MKNLVRLTIVYSIVFSISATKFVAPHKQPQAGQAVKQGINKADKRFLNKKLNIPGELSIYIGLSENTSFAKTAPEETSLTSVKKQLDSLMRIKKNEVKHYYQVATLQKKVGRPDLALNFVDKAITLVFKENKNKKIPSDLNYSETKNLAELVYFKASVVPRQYKRQLLMQCLQLAQAALEKKPSKSKEVYTIVGFVLFELANNQDLQTLYQLRDLYREYGKQLEKHNYDFSMLMPVAMAELFAQLYYYGQQDHHIQVKTSVLKDFQYKKLEKAREVHKGDLRYTSLHYFLQLSAMFFKSVLACYQDDFINFEKEKKCLTQDEISQLLKIQSFFLNAYNNKLVNKKDILPIIGVSYVVQRDHYNAFKFFGEAYDIDRANFDKMQLMAAYYLKINENSASLAKVIDQHIAAVKDKTPRVHLWLARLYEMRFKYKKAAKHCTLSGADPEARLCEAIMLIKQNNLPGAKKIMLGLVQNNKWQKHDTALLVTGVIFLLEKNSDEAYFYLDKALQLNPNLEKAKEILARFYYK